MNRTPEIIDALAAFPGVDNDGHERHDNALLREHAQELVCNGNARLNTRSIQLRREVYKTGE